MDAKFWCLIQQLFNLSLTFQSHSTLPKNNIRMIIRRNKHRPRLTLHFPHNLFPLLTRTPTKMHNCTLRLRSRDFTRRRNSRHNNMRGDTKCLRRKTQCLRMVPATMCYYSRAAQVLQTKRRYEPCDGVEGAADFEGADALEVFAFEEQAEFGVGGGLTFPLCAL